MINYTTFCTIECTSETAFNNNETHSIKQLNCTLLCIIVRAIKYEHTHLYIHIYIYLERIITYYILHFITEYKI
jgi:hypothetical protein